MTEIETFPIENTRRLQFNWLLPIIWQPRKTFSRVVEQTKGTWLTPLLVLTLVAILSVLAAAPIRQSASQAVPQEPPPDFQYWSPEQQQQFFEAQTATSSPVFTYVLPMASALLKIWLGWLVFGAVLHLVLTLAGSRTSMTTVLNIVAWASVPLVLRYIVQTISMLSTRQLISAPGLSGFTPAGDTTLVHLVGAILTLVDAYLIWQIVLILIGLKDLSGLSTTKAITSTLIAVVISLVLVALPGFAMAQLGGLSVTQPFFFF